MSSVTGSRAMRRRTGYHPRQTTVLFMRLYWPRIEQPLFLHTAAEGSALGQATRWVACPERLNEGDCFKGMEPANPGEDALVARRRARLNLPIPVARQRCATVAHAPPLAAFSISPRTSTVMCSCLSEGAPSLLGHSLKEETSRHLACRGLSGKEMGRCSPFHHRPPIFLSGSNGERAR